MIESEHTPQPEKKLVIPYETGFNERLKAAAAAKKARLDKFQPKPTVTDPAFVQRRDRHAAELDEARRARAVERAAAHQARLEAQAVAAAEAAAMLEAQRKQRKPKASSQRRDRGDALAAFNRRFPS